MKTLRPLLYRKAVECHIELWDSCLRNALAASTRDGIALHMRGVKQRSPCGL